MDANQLEVFFRRLPPPLGFGALASDREVYQFVSSLDVPLSNGRVPFYKTAYELVRRATEAHIPDGGIKDDLTRLINKHFGVCAGRAGGGDASRLRLLCPRCSPCAHLAALEPRQWPTPIASQENAEAGLLSASVAVAVKKLQRRWRASSRAFKLERRKELTASRSAAQCPPISQVLANKEASIAALQQYLAHQPEDRDLARRGFQALRGTTYTFGADSEQGSEDRKVRSLCSTPCSPCALARVLTPAWCAEAVPARTDLAVSLHCGERMTPAAALRGADRLSSRRMRVVCTVSSLFLDAARNTNIIIISTHVCGAAHWQACQCAA